MIETLKVVGDVWEWIHCSSIESSASLRYRPIICLNFSDRFALNRWTATNCTNVQRPDGMTMNHNCWYCYYFDCFGCWSAWFPIFQYPKGHPWRWKSPWCQRYLENKTKPRTSSQWNNVEFAMGFCSYSHKIFLLLLFFFHNRWKHTHRHAQRTLLFPEKSLEWSAERYSTHVYTTEDDSCFADMAI